MPGIRNGQDCLEILKRMEIPTEETKTDGCQHWHKLVGSTDNKNDAIQGFEIERIDTYTWRLRLATRTKAVEFDQKDMKLGEAIRWLWKLRRWYNYELAANWAMLTRNGGKGWKK